MQIEYIKENYSRFSDLKIGDVYRFANGNDHTVYLCYKKQYGQYGIIGHINLTNSAESVNIIDAHAPVIIYKNAKLVLREE